MNYQVIISERALQEIKQYNFHLTIIGPHSDKHKKIRKLLGDLSFEIIETFTFTSSYYF